jgi:hypothetical protein
MLALKELGQNDPLTGQSDLINPELKITAAIVSLLLSFFSLVQVSIANICKYFSV